MDEEGNVDWIGKDEAPAFFGDAEEDAADEE
jgi:hypothetical protein